MMPKLAFFENPSAPMIPSPSPSSRLDIKKFGAGSLDLLKNIRSLGGPDKRLRSFIVQGNMLLDGSGQFPDVAEANSPDAAIRLATEKFRSESKTNYVPCLCVIGDANIYCFDQDRRLRRWDYDIGEAPELKSTFPELFDQEIGGLRKRKCRKFAGGKTLPPIS